MNFHRLVYQVNDVLRDWYKANRVMPDITLYANKSTYAREFGPYHEDPRPDSRLPMRWATVAVVRSEDIGDGVVILSTPTQQVILHAPANAP